MTSLQISSVSNPFGTRNAMAMCGTLNDRADRLGDITLNRADSQPSNGGIAKPTRGTSGAEHVSMTAQAFRITNFR